MTDQDSAAHDRAVAEMTRLHDRIFGGPSWLAVWVITRWIWTCGANSWCPRCRREIGEAGVLAMAAGRHKHTKET